MLDRKHSRIHTRVRIHSYTYTLTVHIHSLSTFCMHTPRTVLHTTSPIPLTHTRNPYPRTRMPPTDACADIIFVMSVVGGIGNVPKSFSISRSKPGFKCNFCTFLPLSHLVHYACYIFFQIVWFNTVKFLQWCFAEKKSGFG